MHTILRALLLSTTSLWFMLTGAPALAWGPLGHRTVGGIADELIAGTPTATKVRAILGSNLQTASVWADCARSVESSGGQWMYADAGKYKDCAVYENKNSQAAMVAFVKRNASRCGGFASHAQCRHKAWHFTDIPIQAKAYAPEAVGAAPTDLVQATGAMIAVLQGKKPAAGFNIASQREALRLLSHYVGDLHQPLHVGSVYLDAHGKAVLPASEAEAHASSNAGGNGIVLKTAKLHALWDDFPSTKAFQLLSPDGKKPGAGAVAARQVPTTGGAVSTWPAGWATDTLGHADDAFVGLTFGTRIGAQWPATSKEPDYRQAREQLQRDQAVKAGARLAQLLTALFP